MSCELKKAVFIMPIYEYRGLDASGQRKEGLLEAGDLRTVKRLLFEQGVLPTKLASIRKTIYQKGPSLSQSAILARQIAMFLKMGFTLDDAFLSAAQSWKKRSLQKKLFLTAQRLREGLDLNRALTDIGLFPKFFLKVLSVAERSGKLVDVLETLASFCDRKYQLRSQWVQSFLYPALLLVVSLGVLGLVFQWVFPSFLELFQQWDRPLPWQTRLVFNLGNWIWNYLGLFLIVAFFLVYQGIKMARQKPMILMKFLLKFPVLQSLLKKRNACDVANHLYLLLNSGFQVPESFEMAGEDRPFIQEELLKFRKHLEEGHGFEEGMILNSIFPREFLKMLSVGFKTGNLTETCQKVSNYYERDLNVFFNRFTTLLGPLLLLGVGVFIGFLVIGVLLPIFDWSF